MKKNLVKTVSILSNIWEVNPRVLWQVMFDLYRENGGDLSRMDNLLIDLSFCERVFKNYPFHTNSECNLYWAFSGRVGHTTARLSNELYENGNFEYQTTVDWYDKYYQFVITEEKIEAWELIK